MEKCIIEVTSDENKFIPLDYYLKIEEGLFEKVKLGKIESYRRSGIRFITCCESDFIDMVTYPPLKYGLIIKRWRTKKGLTTTELGNMLGTDSPHISRIENGQINFRILFWAEFLKISNLEITITEKKETK